MTAKRLAEKLLVSERTIYRYIDDLSVSGIPVYGEPGVGYRLSEGFELPPLQLSPGELEALIAGVNLVASLTGKNLSASAYSLLAKIEASFPQEAKSSHREDTRIRIPFPHNKQPGFGVWEELHSAIAAGRWVTLNYQAESGEQSIRTVFPLGLFYWGGKWTVGCWCFLRKDYRDFRVDRILQLSPASVAPALPDHVSLQAYMSIQEKAQAL